MTRQAVNYIVRLVSEMANLGRVWPHMLRHSCGYYLADKGTDLRTMQDYLGHRDPKDRAHYTRGRPVAIARNPASSIRTRPLNPACNRMRIHARKIIVSASK
jgi:integrase